MALRHLGLQDEISIRDLSEDEDEKEKYQVFYDASDELEDSEEDLAEAIERRLQLKDHGEVVIPQEDWVNKN